MWVVTWNVLHRIHAENWREAVPDRFPDEALRIEAITSRIARLRLELGEVVVCLQEVSGDQRRSLEDRFGSADVVAFRYPRIPVLKSGGLCPLEAPEEHLVTIASGQRPVAASAWPSDPGKGYLAVDVGGLTVVNTHLSGGERRGEQLAGLAAIGGDRLVFAGDFNTGLDPVVRGIGRGVVAADLGLDALPTRPRPDVVSGKPPAIDHVLGRGVRFVDGGVVDVAGESDHNLVRARIA